MVKCLNVSRCNFLFFILDLSEDEFWSGMYLKLDRYFSAQNPYFPELILNFNA